MSDKRNIRDSLFNTYGENKYADVLKRVQSEVSHSLSKDLADFTEKELTQLIYDYIVNNNIKCDLTENAESLANHIYHDMAGFSFITREKIFEIEGFEELNVNAWNNIHIKINGKSRRTNYSFVSPSNSVDIHKRMLAIKNVTLDNATPRATSDIGGNIRLCVSVPPIVDRDVAVSSSIRKVSLTTISLSKLLTRGTLNKDMVDFLVMCVRHGVSICVSGETGSGKTTTLGGILSLVAQKGRMITIEEGSREWDFLVRDDNGTPLNDVVHKLTRPNIENPSLNYDQEFLIKDALRADPAVLAMGEIRGR